MKQFGKIIRAFGPNQVRSQANSSIQPMTSAGFINEEISDWPSWT